MLINNGLPKSLFLIIAVFLLSSCVSENQFLTEHKEGWFKNLDRGLVYCRANVKADGTADPVCFESAIQVFDQTQTKVKK